MRKTALIMTLMLGLALVLPSCSNNSNKSTEKAVTEKVVYTCPMKCEGEKTYDKPGKCPVCGMELEKKVIKAD